MKQREYSWRLLFVSFLLFRTAVSVPRIACFVFIEKQSSLLYDHILFHSNPLFLYISFIFYANMFEFLGFHVFFVLIDNCGISERVPEDFGVGFGDSQIIRS